MRDVGFTVEQQPRDWPTVVARRQEGRLVDVPVYSNAPTLLAADAFYRRGDLQRLPRLVVDNRIPDLLKPSPRRTLDERKKIAARSRSSPTSWSP